MVFPPVFAGAVNDTVSELLLPAIELIVGGSGIVKGVPDTDVDGLELPAALRASNVTGYVVPFDTPVVIVKGLVVVFIKK
jgi:hypothetical protein